MAKPKKSATSASRRRSMPSPHVIVPPAPPPFLLQGHFPEVDAPVLVESPTRYDSQSPHHVWYEQAPSASAGVRLHDHYTPAIGTAGFYHSSVTSSPTLFSYDSAPRLTDDAPQHSPSRVDNNYSLWSGSTLVGDEYYNQKGDFAHEEDLSHKGDHAYKADYVRKDDYAHKDAYALKGDYPHKDAYAHKDDYAHREVYSHKDVYDHKGFYYPEQQPSPTHSYYLRHMTMSEPVPVYQHHTSPTSSPPPYAKITIPRLDSSVSIVSQDDLERHHFAINPSKIYGSTEPPRYAHDQEAEFAANNYPAQWSPPPAWQC